MKHPLQGAVLIAALALVVPGMPHPAQALTMKECSAKYEAAKTAGTLKDQSWNDFRKAECGSDATPAAEKSDKAAKTDKDKSDKSAKAAKTSSEPKKGDASKAVFPNAISSKYSKETPSKGRMHTCLDQYNANKEKNANGGLNWIQKGGGYYSECNKRLKS